MRFVERALASRLSCLLSRSRVHLFAANAAPVSSRSCDLALLRSSTVPAFRALRFSQAPAFAFLSRASVHERLYFDGRGRYHSRNGAQISVPKHLLACVSSCANETSRKPLAARGNEFLYAAAAAPLAEPRSLGSESTSTGEPFVLLSLIPRTAITTGR